MLYDFFQRRTFPLIWLVLVHILLLLPGNSLPKEKIGLIPHLDKLVHFGLYFVMVAGWALFFNLKTDLTQNQKRNWNIILVLLAIGDGIIIEFMQASPIINRDFDWLDALADGVGAIVGLIAGIIFSRYLLKIEGLS
jgi:VanZ family protein